MNKKSCLICALIIFLILTSCSPDSMGNNAAHTGNLNITAVDPSPEPANTNTPLPTQTSTVEPTPEPPVLSYLGTAIPVSNTQINSENYLQLQQTAVWGRGLLSGMAFSPGGDQFVLSSPLGFAIYDVAHLDAPPIWVPFEVPIPHQFITFNESGDLIRVINYGREKAIVEFPSGKLTDNIETTWLPVAEQTIGGPGNSPDGTLTFRSRIKFDEENMSIEYSIRQITNNDTGDVYDLKDDTFHLDYEDNHLPEGCDVAKTGMCWNAYVPSIFHPYIAGFSPDSKLITIIYRVQNYSNDPDYSLLRIYDASNGNLLSMVGDFDHPISTFAYSPDSSQLLIGFKNGSSQIWNIAGEKSIYDSWNFNDTILYAEYTRDGEILLIQRPGILEIRSPYDGALRSRLEIEHYMLSPVDDNIIYFTDADFMIKAMEMDTGKVVLRIPAHEKDILAFSISADGRYLASSSLDCKVKLWDAQSGKFLHYLEETIVDGLEGGPPIVDHENYYNSRIFIKMMEFVEGKDQIIGFGSWGAAVNWNLNSGATNYVIYSAPLKFYQGMMTVNNHFPSNFYVDVDENVFYIDDTKYDLSDGEILGSEPQAAADSPEDCSTFGPTFEGDKYKFTIGYKSNVHKICILDSATNQLVDLISPFGEKKDTDYIKGMLLSPDSTQLLIADNYDVIEIYTIAE